MSDSSRAWAATATVLAALAAIVGLGELTVALGVAVCSVIPLYVLAAKTMGRASGKAVGGVLIGINAVTNGAAWFLLLGGGELGIGVGVSIALLNSAAAWPALSRDRRFQWILGRASWLMPSSWPVLLAGLLFVMVSVLASPFFRIQGLIWEPTTGTLFLHGGWVANLNPVRTAFNMGPFAFIHSASKRLHLEHEAGHALNLAAFGSVFHLVGAVDENWLGSGSKAFAERLAESRVEGTRGEVIGLWG